MVGLNLYCMKNTLLLFLWNLCLFQGLSAQPFHIQPVYGSTNARVVEHPASNDVQVLVGNQAELTGETFSEAGVTQKSSVYSIDFKMRQVTPVNGGYLLVDVLLGNTIACIHLNYNLEQKAIYRYTVSATEKILQLKFTNDNKVALLTQKTSPVFGPYQLYLLDNQLRNQWVYDQFETDMVTAGNARLFPLPGGGIGLYGNSKNKPGKSILFVFRPDGSVRGKPEVDIAFSNATDLFEFPDQLSLMLVDRPMIVTNGPNCLFFDNSLQLIKKTQFGNPLFGVGSETYLPGPLNTILVYGTAINNGQLQTQIATISTNGTIQAQSGAGVFNALQPRRLLKDAQGNLFGCATGYLPSGNTNVPFVHKTASNGTVLWTWTDPSLVGFTLTDATLTSDGGIVFFGISTTNQGTSNHLIKLGADGSLYKHLVKGKVILDSDENCMEGPGETGEPYWVIHFKDKTQDRITLTDQEGNYSFGTQEPTVELEIKNPWYYVEFCQNKVQVQFQPNQAEAKVNFYKQFQDDCSKIAVSFTPATFRRCFINNAYLKLCNTGFKPLENVWIEVLLDDHLDSLTSPFPHQIMPNGAIRFLIGDLQRDECRSVILSYHVKCDVEIGETACLYFTAGADNACEPAMDPYSENQICGEVRASYDPNDIRVWINGLERQDNIPADSLMHFQIRFQNVGNDTAFTVVIRDTLPLNYDLETFVQGVMSHKGRVALQGRTLVWVFDDIMLPDSTTNEPASHGYVNFSIRHQRGLLPGALLPNRAGIYFDFNEVVLTNTLPLKITAPIVGLSPPLKNIKVSHFPHPSYGEVHFAINDPTNAGKYDFSLFDWNGRLLAKEKINSNVFTIHLNGPGTYIYKIQLGNQEIGSGTLIHQP